jgi:uncharacterized protein
VADDDDPWLDDAELEELHQLLSGHGGDDDLLLDGVHGLLTAVIIGPEPVAVEEWLPQVLDADKPFESVATAGRSYALLVRMRDDVERALDAMEWEPILSESDESGEMRHSGRGWCEGFGRGVDLRAALWDARLAADPQLLDLLGPILALAGHDGLLEDDELAPAQPLDDAGYETALNQIGATVHAVQQYWLEHPPGSEDSLPPAPKRVRRWRGARSLH